MTDIDADELLAACRAAFSRSAPARALELLGYADLLPYLDDPASLRAVMSTFEAQGRELACSAALGLLLARPYAAHADCVSGAVATVWSATSTGIRHVLVGEPAGGSVLVDTPGSGAVVVPQSEVVLTPISGPGRLVLHDVDVRHATPQIELDEADIGASRGLATRLGRIALAFEMLGAASAAVELAVDHARNREQFGRPIGGFQAVQHLLAWAVADCEAVGAAALHAVRFPLDTSDHFDVAAKALAGRNAMTACERSLQVLGAIGFTAEHDHHHFHGRVLALDTLLGTRAALTRQLGRAWRTHPDPGTMLARVIVARETHADTR